MTRKKDDNHWDFLEEIDAPMWADLNLEASSIKQESDADDWFNTTHLFHQCSSRRLKLCAFSHSGFEDLESNFESEVSSSSKLPASVSRSRGGQRGRSRKESQRPSVKIPVGKKLAFDPKPNKERGPSPRSAAEPVRCLSRVISTNRPKLVSGSVDVRRASSSTEIPRSKGDSGSIFSYQSCDNHHGRAPENKGGSAGNRNKLLFNMRTSMRKSHGTRKEAWRVEATSQCHEHSEVHRSTSGHGRYTEKGISRNGKNLSRSITPRLKSGNGSMAVDASIAEKVTSGKQFRSHEIQKSKVIQPNIVRKALIPIKMKKDSQNVSRAMPYCSAKENESCSGLTFLDKSYILPTLKVAKKGTFQKGKKSTLATTIEVRVNREGKKHAKYPR